MGTILVGFKESEGTVHTQKTPDQRPGMKKRYLYVLLFCVPALLASLIISFLLFGALAGVLWIFVLGDNPWSSFASNMLTVMLVLACVTLWVAFMSVVYVVGKKQEEYAALNAKHVMASAGATALLVLLVVWHQWSVGNFGTKSDDVLCSEFCRDKEFAGSGIPPRNAGATTCSCFDEQGREAVKVPMRDITSRSKINEAGQDISLGQNYRIKGGLSSNYESNESFKSGLANKSLPAS